MVYGARRVLGSPAGEVYYTFTVERLDAGRYALANTSVTVTGRASTWKIEGLDELAGLTWLSARAGLSAAAYALHKAGHRDPTTRVDPKTGKEASFS